MSRTLVRLGVTAALSTALLAAPVAGAAKTRVVDDDGRATPTDCNATARAPKRIQAAVTASAAGDTVKVCPGVYVEKVRITGARTGLKLISTKNKGATIKDPNVYAYPLPPIVHIDGVANVLVRGFKVRALHKGVYASSALDGIVADGAVNVTIKGNHVSWAGPAGSWSQLLRGIVATGGTTGLITGNTVVDALETGIHVGDNPAAGTNVTVQGNTVKALFNGLNSTEPPALNAFSGYGIQVHTARATIAGNTVIGVLVYGINTTLNNGIRVYTPDGFGGGASTIRGNTVTGPTVGISVRGVGHTVGGSTAGAGNTVTSRQTAISLDNLDNGVVRFNDANATSNGAGSIFASSNSDGNQVLDNDFRGSPGTDCTDQGGTPLGNTWSRNLGAESSPSGICSLPVP